jgi:hypothetical protein
MLIRKPRSFEFLLGFLLVLLVLAPALDAAFFTNDVVKVVAAAAVVITATRVAWTHELRYRIVLVLGLAAFVGELIRDESYIHIADLAFYTYLAVAFSGYVFRTRNVTGNVVAASLCVYIIIGILWAHLYLILDVIEEGRDSFANLSPGEEQKRSELVYFSFVTLTTLGYGDVTPVTRYARSAAMVEAIVGQIYLVVIVARLVALRLTHDLQGEKKT